MKFSEIARRINGLTVGPVGLQWTSKPTEAEAARRVLRFLEDRRILFNDCAAEEPDHCVRSAIEIRRVLTEEIGKLDDDSALLVSLRIIPSACRRLLDRLSERRVLHLSNNWE